MLAENYYTLPHHQLEDVPISKFSNWNDDIWQFETTTGGARDKAGKINWAFPVDGGALFSAPKYMILRESCKVILWSLMRNKQSGKALKEGSIGNQSTQFMYFIKWMVREHIKDFSGLTYSVVGDFVDYLEMDKAKSLVNEDGLGWKSIHRYLMVPRYIFDQRRFLDKRGLPKIPEEPFKSITAKQLSQEIAIEVEVDDKTMPDDVFLPVTATCIKWVDEYSHDILRVQNLYYDAFEKGGPGGVKGEGQSRVVKIKYARLAVENFEFSGESPWRRKLGQEDIHRYEDDGKSIITGPMMPATDLRRIINLLTSACTISIQAFVGMRISEVCGLDCTRDPDSEWPSCVSVEKSVSGLNEVFYVKGRYFKMTPNQKEGEWVAGMRPIGTDYIPPPIKAILILEKLYAYQRKISGRNELILRNSSSKGLALDFDNVKAPLSENLNEECRLFVAKYCGKDIEWRVTTHQWRKRFAKYVFGVDSSLLPVISTHFKHMNLAMVEQSYIGNNPEILKIMDDEAANNAVVGLMELSGGKQSVGKIVEHIRARAVELGVRFGNYSKKDALRETKSYVEASGIRRYSLKSGDEGYGDCWFRQGSGACSTSCPVGRMYQLMPDFSYLNPSICHICENLVVDEDQKPFWQKRLSDNRTILESEAEMSLRMQAQIRIDEATIILSKFERLSDEKH